MHHTITIVIIICFKIARNELCGFFFIPKMIIQTMQMHSEMEFNWHDVSFTWYSVFQKWKRNSFKFIQLLHQHVKGNRLLLNSCSLIPAKWYNLMLSPVAQVCFLELKWELECICVNSFLLCSICTEPMDGKFQIMAWCWNHTEAGSTQKNLTFQNLWD